MDTIKAKKLYHEHANAVGYVEVENSAGDRSIGTCFHVGEGVFVTARHVVEKNRILEVRITEPVGIRASELMPELSADYLEAWDKAIEERLGIIPFYKHWLDPLTICAGVALMLRS